jgi:hypothetical protein
MKTLILIAAMLTGQSLLQAADLDLVETDEAREAIELAREEVAKYTLYLDNDRNAKLRLRPEPILRWTNHLRRRFYSDVFIWTHDGRPEAVATITNCYHGEYHAMETEAHSLSLTKFTATREDLPMWNPTDAGIELVRVPDAPAVANTPAQRLQQMRRIARQFSAISLRGPESFQLRLLSQPVYRYASTDPEVTDGAMFAFVKGTDPDIFLLIEARRTAEKTAWQYALARFNSHVSLRVSYNDRDVWTVPRLPGKSLKNPKSSYFAFQKRLSAIGGKESE